MRVFLPCTPPFAMLNSVASRPVEVVEHGEGLILIVNAEHVVREQ